ncbi:LpqB family beta-propeller domain-containing protein [Nakamurella deserti]|uniref:LpqB family beta-propeller domain-containing protein n=1 Tax=Nakamurella deserti TaxID=2164074 RepID=UPI000DBE8990|nr:LpqB family beta-propeller domain-containing protein [Nakamurella deserti]
MRSKLVILLVAALVAVTGCATVPSGGDPIDYTQVADPGTQVRETTPADGLSPQEIVRGFVAAGARIDQDLPLVAARSYLTDAAKVSWRTDQGGVMILSASPRYDVLTGPSGAGDTVQLSGTSDGYLASDGSYVPTPRTEFTVAIALVQVNGEWRIQNPPEQLILSVSDFNLAFTQREVYFLNHAGTLVVPDRRWLPNSSLSPGTLVSRLVDSLIAGPSTPLIGAVRNSLQGARPRVPITATADGVLQVDLTGLPSLTAAAARGVAAELVYTLRLDAARIRILVDGTPLDANQAIWTTGVLGSFDPDGVPGSGPTSTVGYYVTDQGAVVNLRGVPLSGNAGTGELAAVSAGMSAATGDLAVVGGPEGAQTLYVGAPLAPEPMEPRLTAQTFTPPSFSRSGDEVWTVINGATSPEVVRLLTDGSRYPVDSSSLAGLGPVTGLALSSDGARVAVVADGGLYLASVIYADDATAGGDSGGGSGVATVGVPVRLRNDLTVRTVLWSNSLNLLVAASDPASTYRAVWRIGVDGRQRSALSTRGIVADVDAVGATGALPTLISSGGVILQLRGDDSSGDWVPVDPEGATAVGRWPLYPA